MVGRGLKGRLQSLGGNLRRWRLRRGLTQEQMVELSGLTDDRFLRRIERGEVNVRLGTLFKLSESLAVEPGVLLRKPKVSAAKKTATKRRSGPGKG